MASTKISALTNGAPVQSTDELVIARAGSNFKLTAAQLSMVPTVWTGAFATGTSGTITINPSFNTGRYVQNGRVVTLTGLFKVQSVSAPVGELYLTGLPVANGTGFAFRTGVSFYADALAATAITQVTAFIESAESRITFRKYAAGAAAALAGDVVANTEFWINVTYFTD